MTSAGATVVVGADPGLCMAAARRFGRDGHPVGLIARNAATLETIGTDLGSEGYTAATEAADVTDEKALTLAFGALRERLGPIEVVLFSPRPNIGRIKSVLDTAPTDIVSATALSVDRAVFGSTYAAESAYTHMLHDTHFADFVHAAQITVVGSIGPGARHEPDEVAKQLWGLHPTRHKPLLVLR